MTSIQTWGSCDEITDEFTFSMVFGDSPALTFEGMTREQVTNIRDCLDCMLWQELDSDYGETLDAMRMTIGPYVSVMDEEDAAKEVLETIRALLLRKVDFTDGENSDGVLNWHEVEAMITRPLDHE